jgi:hypothetical protein
MSSPQSRQRQRHRRRAREKLWDAQKEMAERGVDLVCYERVLTDMAKRPLPPFGGAQAVAIVRVCRDAMKSDYERLEQVVADLEKAHAALAPSDPKETMLP